MIASSQTPEATLRLISELAGKHVSTGNNHPIRTSAHGEQVSATIGTLGELLQDSRPAAAARIATALSFSKQAGRPNNRLAWCEHFAQVKAIADEELGALGTAPSAVAAIGKHKFANRIAAMRTRAAAARKETPATAPTSAKSAAEAAIAADAQAFEKYQTLLGQQRRDFYTQNEGAIWRAYRRRKTAA